MNQDRESVRGGRGRGGAAVRALLACVVLASLAGCVNLAEDETATHLSTLNLIDDSPSLQFVLDSTVVSTAAYGSGSKFGPAPSGKHSVHFSAVRPTRLPGDSGTTAAVDIGAPADQTFADDTDYTLIACGTMANPQTVLVDAADQRADVAAAKFAWRIAHAAPGAAAVDVYITAPEAGISAPQFVATLGFGADSASQELTLQRQPGQADSDVLNVSLTVELRASGTNTVLYTSGAVQFTEKTRTFFAIANNTSGLGSAFQLVALAADGTGSVLHDPGDPASVRGAHVSYDTAALDLVRDATPVQTIVQNLAFGSPASPRVSVPNGSTQLFAPLTGNPANSAFSTLFTAARAQPYTVYAVGPYASLSGVVLADSVRKVPTEAQVRFLHAAGSQGSLALDVYVTLSGKALDFNPDDDRDGTDDAANLRQVAALGYGAASAYLALPEGNYDIYFAVTGSQSTVLGPVPIQLANGTTQTLALVDASASATAMLPFDDAAN